MAVASGPFGRRACGGHDGPPGSAVRPVGPFAAGPVWHSHRRSRADRGRSNCKRSPGRGNRRTGTDGLIAGRAPLCRRHSVDERHRWQDSRPVRVPGMVWGTASMQNLQVARGAVLAPKHWQAPAAPSSCGSPSTSARAPPARFSHRTPASDPLSRSGWCTRSHAARRCTPAVTRAASPLLTLGKVLFQVLRESGYITEGTANFLVNRRMNKSQQMRWSRRGAGLLLQVRCAIASTIGPASSTSRESSFFS